MKSLRELYISGNPLASLDALAHNDRLEIVEARGCGAIALCRDRSVIKSLTNLRHLDLCDNERLWAGDAQQANAAFECLQYLFNVKRLLLRNTGFSGMSSLSKVFRRLQKLEELDLRCGE